MTADDATGASADEGGPEVDPPAPAVDDTAPEADVDVGDSVAPQPDVSQEGDADDDLPIRSRVALDRVKAPDHQSEFWDDLDRAFADEPQLRITPRAAIRPITQPPPIIDERHIGDEATGSSLQLPPLRPRRRLWPWAAAAVVVGLLIVGLVRTQDEPTTETGDSPPETTPADSPDDDEASPSEKAAPSSTPVAPDARLEPAGIGPLQVGISLRELEADGIGAAAELRTFEASGGTCFDATVHGSPDLTLRFRTPELGTAMGDPGDGRLVAVDVKGPTNRSVAGTGVALDAPQEQVLTAYAGNIVDAPHPFAPGGHVYIVPVGNGTGVAFGTDGRVVTSISVGLMDVIGHMAGCG